MNQDLEWKKKESYGLLADTMYHAYQAATSIKKDAGLKDMWAMVKNAPRNLGRRITQRASNVEGLTNYADDLLLSGKKLSDKQKSKQLEVIIEEAVNSFNKGETELLTLQNLVREKSRLDRPGMDKLLDAVKEIAKDKPLATAMAVGGTSGLVAHNLADNRRY